jgi:hypothetical protein
VAIYQAFNSNGGSVVVTDAELDDAAGEDGPLSAELADAAAQARRTDLVDRLRRSLDGADRARKLAAAKALLALDDREAGVLLESLATSESDTVVAKSFIAVATRLRGPQVVLDVFGNPETDPQLARLLLSNYNSHLRLNAGDIGFLVIALRHYLARSLPWLPTLGIDLWNNGVYLILNALSNDGAVRLLRAAMPPTLLPLLAAVPEHTDDDDIASCATDLRAVLTD